MKVLIVGHSGQLAQSLRLARWPGEWRVTAIGRPELDLTDNASIARQLTAFQPQVVVNAAAYTAVDKAEDEAAAAHALNAAGVGGLAEQCSARNLPLIHISTDYVFDGTKAGAYAESDPVAPLGVYGHTKLAGEQAIAEVLDRFVILRTAWVFSPYGHNFVKTMLRLAGERDHLNVVDDQHGSPTYAPHLADAIVRIAGRMLDGVGSNEITGVYHAAGEGETTWCGLARAVFEESQKLGGPIATVGAITTEEYPTPAKRPANSRLATDKLAETFGVRLPHWRQGVARCVKELLTT